MGCLIGRAYDGNRTTFVVLGGSLFLSWELKSTYPPEMLVNKIIY